MVAIAAAAAAAIFVGEVGVAAAHDIPNARIDRSIQVEVERGRLRVAYEVSLGELTLFQDLRGLTGERPRGDRAEVFNQYGRETGPLDARGLLVRVDGRELSLACDGFDLVVEEHPRFTFHLSAALPERGRLSIRDTNYASSEGVSRLAIRAAAGVTLSGDDLPSDVNSMEARPDWQLDDAELRRSRGVEVRYSPAGGRTSAAGSAMISVEGSSERPDVGPASAAAGGGSPAKSQSVSRSKSDRARAATANPLTKLLDRAGAAPTYWLFAIAVVLGAAHSIQPGHGKTLAAASVVAERGRTRQAVTLALVTTVTHMSSTALVAVGLYWSGAVGFGSIHRAVVGVAGFAIAAVGFWRLGRLVGGYAEHEAEAGALKKPPRRFAGLVALGVAGGALPCWDAIGLVVWADAAGRLALGLTLLAGFSVGMAAVLIAVATAAAQGRRLLARLGAAGVRGVAQAPAIIAALVLCAIGVSLMLF